LIVSVDYADYLKHTLPSNKPHFDDLVVLTTAADTETHDVCKANGVTYVVTNAFYREGAPFNKGRGINKGFERLNRTAWILHLDADIVLPDDFREALESRELNRDVLYGVDRLMCNSYASWLGYVHGDRRATDFKTYRRHRDRDGRYSPVGYFQLFHVAADALKRRERWYPERFPTATKSDRAFSRKWRRRERLEGITVIHLATDGTCRNWQGRQSARFGAE